MSWKTRASCRGRGDIDWDTFGPVQVLVCAGCPVRAECLHMGLQEPEACGTWGMTSEAQRNQIRNGRTTVSDVWELNADTAERWHEESRRGPTLVWDIR